jgi:hypothetical protein
MNIKIGDLLFEEDNSNKIHEVFENNLLKEDDHEKNMTKVELDKINPLIARKIKSIYPGEEKILDDIEKTGEEEAPGSIKTGSLKLQGRNIGSGVEINIFNIYLDGDKVKGADPEAGMKDLNKYEELGIIVFELVQGGETLSGENSQGHNIRQFFVIPFPGWKTSDKNLIDMHTKFFNIDFRDVDPEDFKGKPVFVHLGLGKKFHSFPIVEKDESGKEIKELRTALKNGNLPKLMLFVEKSKLGTARSTISDKSEKTKQQTDRDTYTKQGEQQEDSDQQNKDITASVKESYIHKDRLSDLLFEKKSLNKLSTKQKKVLVENYFNVNYSDLNNFQKRDYYTATKLLILNENNKLLTETTDSQSDSSKTRSEDEIDPDVEAALTDLLNSHIDDNDADTAGEDFEDFDNTEVYTAPSLFANVVIVDSDQEGSDQEGSDQEGSDQEGSDQEGSDQEGSDQEAEDEEAEDEEAEDEEAEDEEAEELTVLSKSAAKRLQKKLTKEMSDNKAAKIKITEQDVANALKKDLSKMVYSYHKAYNTDTFQRIENNVNDNFSKSKRKEAKGVVDRKTGIGLAIGLGGALLSLTGLGSAIGIPLMIVGGGVYSNRAGTFEDDQLVGGDERESELDSQIKKLTKEDVETLTEIIIDISKETKGIDESSLLDGDLIAEAFNDLIHKNKLSYILFNEEDKTKTANVGYPVSKVKDYLQGRSVMCYDGTLTPGSKVFEKAEAFTLSSICSLLRSMCGITISGLESYMEPAAVAAKAETYANASVNAKAPVGTPAMSSLAAISADAPAPQMNQPINPTQFAAMINKSGGNNAKTFTRFMMYHMLLQQTGGNSDRALKQLEDFLQAMGEGKVTTEEAIDTISSMVDSAPESVKTTVSQDVDGSDTTTTTTTESFAEALEDAVKEMNDKLPNVRKSDVIEIFKNLLKINKIASHDKLNRFNLLLTDRGKEIFPSKIDDKSLEAFGKHHLSGRINIVKDAEISEYNAEQAFDIALSIDKIFFTSLDKKFNPEKNIIEMNQKNKKEILAKFTTNNVDISYVEAYLEACVFYCFISKVINNVTGSNHLNVKLDFEAWANEEDWIKGRPAAASDLELMNSFGPELVKIAGDKIVGDLEESRITRKPVIDNRVRRKRKEFVKEDYLMGDLSSLLFNESVSIEGKKKKEVKLSNSNINLSKEWLKIWDI